MLKKCELPSQRGTEKLIEELQQVNHGIGITRIQNLEEHYANYLLIGDKALKIYKVSRSVIDLLIESWRKHSLESTEFGNRFPLLLTEEELSRTDGRSKIIKIIENQESLDIVFCTKRFSVERKDLSMGDFSDDLRAELKDYDELIGVKRYDRQFFDVVSLHKSKNIIEVRIDISGNVKREIRDAAFRQIVNAFNVQSNAFYGINSPLNSEVDFFPIIDKLYHCNDAKVYEIKFLTEEGSTKYAKMKRNGDDLRQESFHRHGRAGVRTIGIYGITVFWEHQIIDGETINPEIKVMGRSTMLSKPESAFISQISISRCVFQEDYRFVLEKVISDLDDVL
ncbi:MAG: hypothetical protein F6J87_06200 [Spirulina sp. SIO3F2]|nr:hypothetical protein [Spirulina sp. SIO3F2]